LLRCVAVQQQLVHLEAASQGQVTVCCSVLQRVAACSSALQCDAVCCSAEAVGTLKGCFVRADHGVLQCIAVCCSVLHCVSVCCSVLQCVTEQRHEGRSRGTCDITLCGCVHV